VHHDEIPPPELDDGRDISTQLMVCRAQCEARFEGFTEVREDIRELKTSLLGTREKPGYIVIVDRLWEWKSAEEGRLNSWRKWKLAVVATILSIVATAVVSRVSANVKIAAPAPAQQTISK